MELCERTHIGTGFTDFISTLREVTVAHPESGLHDPLDSALRNHLNLGPEPTVVRVIDQGHPEEVGRGD